MANRRVTPHFAKRAASCGFEAHPALPPTTVAPRFGSQTPSYKLGLAIATLACIVSSYIIVTSLIAAYRVYCPVPYGDMWWFVRDAALYRSHKIGLGHLWAQHGEHRLVLPRLLFWADVNIDNLRGVFTIGCSMLLLAGQGLLLWCAFAQMLKNDLASKLSYAALVFGMMFSASQIENLMFPFQVQFPLAFLAASTSIVFTLHHCWAPDNKWRSLIIGIVTAVCATLSLGCGLLVWPILLLICVVERARKQTIWMVAIAGIAIWLAYFRGYVSPDDSTRPWLSVAQPLPVAVFTLMFLVSVIHSTPIHFSGLLASVILLGATSGIFIYLRTSSTAFRKGTRSLSTWCCLS